LLILIVKGGISKMANLWQYKLLPKRIGKFFGKQWFLVIFAKFGTLHQPVMWWASKWPLKPNQIQGFHWTETAGTGTYSYNLHNWKNEFWGNILRGFFQIFMKQHW